MTTPSKMLDLIVKENWFNAQATIGFWPANADGDDIAVYADDAARQQIATFHTLRQQLEKREGRFNSALSDFIAPAIERRAGLYRRLRGYRGDRRGHCRRPLQERQ